MISVIVYGRNDSHGYNLPKRAAIGLNCLGELLSDDTDEIIFVDYNTPDGLPTFPEAIQDTLTGRTKARLRVIRVRSAFHRRRYAHRTHLNVLEPVARNIALRRSDPHNRWVLSTNPDMIFVPNGDEADLSRIAASLPDGFYHLPRFELPEALWESFDRSQPQTVIRDMRDLSRRYHLDEIVFGDPRILYDGPGDFQLCLRRDLVAIDGFDEDMLLGWHVDSNLAVRLGLLRGAVQSVADRLRGYHCDHTRQPTVLHAGDLPRNDIVRFVDGVTGPSLRNQRRNWGAPDKAFEEVRLGRSDGFVRYRQALDRGVGKPQEEPYVVSYTGAAWGPSRYEPDHVLPFVADLLTNLPPAPRILFYLCSDTLLERLAVLVPALLPEARLLVPDDAPSLGGGARAGPMSLVSRQEGFAEADVQIFEVSAVERAPHAHDHVHRALRAAFAYESERQSRGGEPRRFVVVNAVNSAVEQTVNEHLDTALAPFSSRIRHGFLRSRPGLSR